MVESIGFESDKDHVAESEAQKVQGTIIEGK